jgi:membrane fusion protein (multidrug efflux system)
MRTALMRRSIVRMLVLALVSGAAFVACGGEEAKSGDGTAKSDSTKTDSTKADTAAVDTAKVDTAKTKKKVPEGVPVKVREVATGEISSYLLYNATVETEEIVDVYAQATGLVRRVLAEEGDRVEEGRILVRLADEDLKLSEAEAQVNYRKLESQFERTKEMYTRKLIAVEDYEKFKFELEQAKIRWARAELALDFAAVRSPAPGVVAERMVKLGDRIGPGNKLYSIVNLNKLIAKVHVPGRELRNLSVGQTAKVTTDFLPDVSFTGRIIRISPVVDPASGTFKVTVGLDGTEGALRPGMFVTSHIVTSTHKDAVLVPKRAVVYDDGLPHVFLIADSTATKVQLKVGFEDSDNLEVLSGATGGDSIVVVGQNGLKDKAKIRVITGEGLRIPAKPDTTEKKSE